MPQIALILPTPINHIMQETLVCKLRETHICSAADQQTQLLYDMHIAPARRPRWKTPQATSVIYRNAKPSQNMKNTAKHILLHCFLPQTHRGTRQIQTLDHRVGDLLRDPPSSRNPSKTDHRKGRKVRDRYDGVAWQHQIIGVTGPNSKNKQKFTVFICQIWLSYWNNGV